MLRIFAKAAIVATSLILLASPISVVAASNTGGIGPHSTLNDQTLNESLYALNHHNKTAAWFEGER